MRRPLFVFASLGWALGAVVACQVMPLEVGRDVPDVEDAAPPVDAAPETAPDTSRVQTLEERLIARCAEEPGSLDSYFSAADLTQRLDARWYGCDPAIKSPLQDGDGAGFTFRADGTWAVLSWNAARDGFVAETVLTYNYGRYRYRSIVDLDAGTAADGGGMPSDVPLNDTKPRSALGVYLDRGGGYDPHSFTFTKKPRQMDVAEVSPGPNPLRARYVPID